MLVLLEVRLEREDYVRDQLMEYVRVSRELSFMSLNELGVNSLEKNNLYGRHENNCVEDNTSTHITEQIGGTQVITTYRIVVRIFITANGIVQEILI